MNEVIEFLEKAELHGKNISTIMGPQIDIGNGEPPLDPATHNVAYEARQLKAIFLKLYDF